MSPNFFLRLRVASIQKQQVATALESLSVRAKVPSDAGRLTIAQIKDLRLRFHGCYEQSLCSTILFGGKDFIFDEQDSATSMCQMTCMFPCTGAPARAWRRGADAWRHSERRLCCAAAII